MLSDERVSWIARTSDLASWVERLGPGPVALDTEADSMHHYREQTCLVQISSGGFDLLIDPLAGVDLSLLAPMLVDRSVTKILHGADYDLRLLDRDHSLRVEGLFDTMVAARLVGERAFGLATLLENHLGVRLDKRFQRADWSQRPLPAEMQSYAVLDTRHLTQLAEDLGRRLDELGRRAWAEEEFRQLEQVRWSAEGRDKPAHQRFKGSGKMSRRELAVLVAVLELREGIAREKNRPPFKVLTEACIRELVRLRPVDAATLARVGGLPRAWDRPARKQPLLQAIETALALPEEALPQRPPSNRTVRDPEFDSRVRELCRRRDKVAEGLDLEPSLVGSRRQLEQVQRALDESADPRALPDLRRWQLGVLGPALGF